MLVVASFRNGYSRSGLYCASSYLLNMAASEQEVDVVYAVRDMRLTLLKAIASMVKIIFCYRGWVAASSLKNSFGIRCNTLLCHVSFQSQYTFLHELILEYVRQAAPESTSL